MDFFSGNAVQVIFAPVTPLDIALGVIVAWLAIGISGVVLPIRLQFISRVLFPLGALGGAALAVAGFLTLSHAPSVVVLPIGLPNLPAHLRLDSLSGFFLVLLGAVSAGISLFSAGYFREAEGTSPGLLCIQYHVFLASMAGVLLADSDRDQAGIA